MTHRFARRISFSALAGLALAGMTLPSTPALPTDSVVRTPNMTHVTNLQYPLEAYPVGSATFFNYTATARQGGTDLETTTLTADVGNGPEPRDFVVAGSYRNGLQLVDVTDPKNPELAQTFDCGLAQGDVQIFTRGGHTYAAYAQDDILGDARYTTACFQDALALYGLGTPQSPGDAQLINGFGTLIIDITNPYTTTGPERVRTVGWARELDGSHNTTIHPSGNWIYNSNQDLVATTPLNGQPLYRIEVFDLTDLANPTKVFELPLTTGTGPHDITFSSDGTRAYVAAVSHSVILDTTNPAAPSVIGTVIDPAINIHHQADPIDVDGRRYMVVSDELAGVIQGAGVCPGGGLHVYDVTGDLERTPLKVGYFAIPQIDPPGQSHLRCTAHVFKAYPDQGLMTVAWYGAGVRVLDITGLVGASIGIDPNIGGSGGTGMREVGSFFFRSGSGQVGSQTWAAKVHRFEADGSAYIFANDLDRGFDVYYYDANAPQASDPGAWLDTEQALDRLTEQRAAVGASSNRPSCVIG